MVGNQDEYAIESLRLVRSELGCVVNEKEKVVSMKIFSKWLCILAGAAIAPLINVQAQTQCSDGIDNDGDGLVDAYTELPTLNGQEFRVGGQGDPEAVRATVQGLITSKRFNLKLPTSVAVLLRSDGGTWGNTGTDQATNVTEHLPTLQTVCRVLGYRDYVSSTCRDDERSWRYPNGKCNYHSPGDNYQWRIVNGDFQIETANPKYGKTWIASILCKNKLPSCSDGWDNDGDGAIDLQDTGCRNANDDSEKPHDPKCSTPTGPTEAEQCRNLVDDDNDGLVDAADPGCWTNTENPATYNPSLDDESRATSQCQDGRDNDGDGAADLADFSCGGSRTRNDEANPKAQCQDGIDNDRDGAIDLGDFSCSSNQDNDEASPNSQCQDGQDNDSDGAVDTVDPGCDGPQDNNESGEPTRVSVGVECVFDNQDGTYTAYFGYENTSGQVLDVTTSGDGRTRNEFSPGNPVRGQVTQFKLGRNKGAFSVLFNGDAITWSVRAAGSSLSRATATKGSTPCGRLEPIAECINGTAEGIRATFGYRNPNDFTISVPVGALNFFAPAPTNRGQPTQLLGGLNKAAFTTLFTDGLSWKLDGLSATVSKSTPVCPGGCVDTPIGTVKSDLDKIAVDLASLTSKAAKQLGTIATQQARQGRVSASFASSLKRDANRAAKKAALLAKKAQSLTIAFPEVIRSCPFLQPFCESTDRGETIEALKGLYAQIVNQLKRIRARQNFKLTGTTNRGDTFVREGKDLQAAGTEQLSKLPRVETVCK